MFVVILFAKVLIPPDAAAMFRTIALAVKVALILVTDGSTTPSARESALEQLLDALERISHERFLALEHALTQLDRRASELLASKEMLRLANIEAERRGSDALLASEARLRRLWDSNIIGVMCGRGADSTGDREPRCERCEVHTQGGRITVGLSGGPGCVSFIVRDTGQGIAPDFLPHVFDRFRQADASTSRGHGGLGLGLAIVKHIVDLHGGTVVAASEGLGKGTSFVVTLPQRSPDAAGMTWQPETSTQCSLSGTTVLVVDDDPEGREIAQRVLETQGATVVTAGSAREALEALARQRPHVVVSDIGMPEIDGYQLVQQLGDVPAVALTAFARPEDRKRALDAGFKAHVTKPVDPNELVAAVATQRVAASAVA